MTTSPTLPVDRQFSARTGYAIGLIHEAIGYVHHAVSTLGLCANAPHWPDTPHLNTWQAPRWVTTAHQFRSHTAIPCGCHPHNLRQATDLTGTWLHLWTQAIRHIERPDRYDQYTVLRALYVVRDFAECLINAEPFTILSDDPLTRDQDCADDPPLWRQIQHYQTARHGSIPASPGNDANQTEPLPPHHGQGNPPF